MRLDFSWQRREAKLSYFCGSDIWFLMKSCDKKFSTTLEKTDYVTRIWRVPSPIAELTFLAFVSSIAVNTNARSIPETEVVGSCATAALIIGPTVYGGIVTLQEKTRNTNDDNRHRDDDNPEREARQVSACLPTEQNALVKEFHSSTRQSSLARTRVPSRPAL